MVNQNTNTPSKWSMDFAKNLMRIETGSKNTEQKNEYGNYPFFVRSQKTERIDTYSYDCEAVLTAGDGVGTGKVFHYINGKFDAHQRVYVMHDFNAINGKFFYWYFSKNFYDEVTKYTAKSSVDSVRRDMIAEMLIPIPPKSEQETIAQYLFDIDGMIQSLEKLIEKKKAIYQCCIEHYFENVSNNTIKLGELAYLVTKQTGFDYTSTIQPALVTSKNSNTYPYIQTKFFHDRDFCFDTDYYMPKEIADNFPKLLLKEKSLLISIVGSLGNVGIYDFDKTSFLGGAICIAKFKKNIDVDFVYFFLKSKMGLKQIDNCTKGAVQPTLTVEDIRKFDIPDFKEQQKVSIVNALRDFEFDITKTNEKLNAFRMIKQGMMEQLLTGKIRLI